MHHVMGLALDAAMITPAMGKAGTDPTKTLAAALSGTDELGIAKGILVDGIHGDEDVAVIIRAEALRHEGIHAIEVLFVEFRKARRIALCRFNQGPLDVALSHLQGASPELLSWSVNGRSGEKSYGWGHFLSDAGR